MLGDRKPGRGGWPAAGRLDRQQGDPLAPQSPVAGCRATKAKSHDFRRRSGATLDAATSAPSRRRRLLPDRGRAARSSRAFPTASAWSVRCRDRLSGDDPIALAQHAMRQLTRADRLRTDVQLDRSCERWLGQRLDQRSRSELRPGCEPAAAAARACRLIAMLEPVPLVGRARKTSLSRPRRIAGARIEAMREADAEPARACARRLTLPPRIDGEHGRAAIHAHIRRRTPSGCGAAVGGASVRGAAGARGWRARAGAF